MKNTSHNLFPWAALSVALLVLTGCVSNPAPRIVCLPVAPGLLPPEHREAVWFPDQIAPYTIGRYVDPRDPHVLHEAHTIYRREQTSRPNLTPSPVLVFPPVAAAPAINVTAMLRDALTAEVNQQRATSQAIIEQARNLDQHLRRLNAQTQEFRVALQESHRLREQLTAVTNRLEVIEGQLRTTSGVPINSFPKNSFTNPASRP